MAGGTEGAWGGDGKAGKLWLGWKTNVFWYPKDICKPGWWEKAYVTDLGVSHVVCRGNAGFPRQRQLWSAGPAQSVQETSLTAGEWNARGALYLAKASSIWTSHKCPCEHDLTVQKMWQNQFWSSVRWKKRLATGVHRSPYPWTSTARNYSQVWRIVCRGRKREGWARLKILMGESR